MKNVKMHQLFSVILTVCLLIIALAVPAFAEDKGYSDVFRVYYLEGLDKNVNTSALAYMFGSPKNDSSQNYALVLKGNNRDILMDFMSGDKVDQMSKTAISSSQVDINNLNEFLLANGADDDMLLTATRPMIIDDLKKAIAEQKSTLTTTDGFFLSPDALRIAKQSGGSTFRIHCDNVAGKSVVVRVTVTPSKTTKGVITVAQLGNPNVSKKYSKAYTNQFAVIDFLQEGSFGTTVDVAAKADLTGLDTSNLIFYSYNMLTNKQVQIENPNYSIDEKGYLHFSTTIGGSIVITDKPLTKR